MCVEAELKRDVHEVVERCVNVLVRDAAARVALARGDDARLLFATEPSAKVCRPGASACDDHQDTDDECGRAMDRALSADLLDTASGHSSAGRRRHLESLNSLSLDIVLRCVRAAGIVASVRDVVSVARRRRLPRGCVRRRCMAGMACLAWRAVVATLESARRAIMNLRGLAGHADLIDKALRRR